MNSRIILILAILQSVAFAARVDVWTKRTLRNGSTPSSLAFINGEFHMLRDPGDGRSAKLAASPDGRSWRFLGGAAVSKEIAYGNGLYLAFLEGGFSTLHSRDGVAWTTSRPPGHAWERFASLRFGNGAFLAEVEFSLTSRRPTVFRTDGGTNWTAVLSLETNNFVGNLSFANGVFLWPFYTYTEDRHSLALSTNGLDWSIYTGGGGARPVPPLGKIILAQGRYISVGNPIVTFTSTDDFETHTNLVTATNIFDFTFGQNRYVAVGRGVFHSEDGLNWSKAEVQDVGEISRVAFGNGLFMAIGDMTTLTSTNGIDWEIDGLAIRDIPAIAHREGLFVAAGRKNSSVGSAILVSSNYLDWRILNALPATNVISALAANTNGFLATASAGKGFTSTNGTHWTLTDTGLPDSVNDLVLLDQRHWAVGADAQGGFIAYSMADGQWRVVWNEPGAPLHAIAQGNGVVVAVGGSQLNDGLILSSVDGINWTRSAKLDFQPYAITYASGKFVAAGHFEGIATSTNGFDWKHSLRGQQLIGHVAHHGGEFVAIASMSYGILYTSRDGEQWVQHRPITAGTGLDPNRLPLQENILAAATGSRRMVLSTLEGIYECEIVAPKFQSVQADAGLITLDVDNPLAESFELQTSPDLREWTPVKNTSEPKLLEPQNGQKRFFRMHVR